MTEKERAALGERISNILEKAGITQKELAQRWHVSQSTISNWKTGKVVPPGERLIDIAELGNISLDWLIKGKEYKNRFDANEGYSAQDIGLMFLSLAKIYDLDVESHFTETPSPLVTPSGEGRKVKEKGFTFTLEPNGNVDTKTICLRWLLTHVFEYLGVISGISSSHKKTVYINLLQQMLLTSGTERMESDTQDFVKEMELAAWHKYDPIGIKDFALQEDDARRLKELTGKVYPQTQERELSSKEKEELKEFLKWDKQLENEDSNVEDATKPYSKD